MCSDDIVVWIDVARAVNCGLGGNGEMARLVRGEERRPRGRETALIQNILDEPCTSLLEPGTR